MNAPLFMQVIDTIELRAAAQRTLAAMQKDVATHTDELHRLIEQSAKEAYPDSTHQRVYTSYNQREGEQGPYLQINFATEQHVLTAWDQVLLYATKAVPWPRLSGSIVP